MTERADAVETADTPTELEDLVFGPRERDDDSGEALPLLGAPAPEPSEAERQAVRPDAPAPESEPQTESGTPEPGAGARIGIAGGREVGKSYLFQSMVYRTQAGERSGALAYFLERDSIELTSAAGFGGRHRRENLEEFLRSYESWQRLEPTRLVTQRCYRLRLGYRCGLFGHRRARLDLEFLDGSGEGFFEAPLTQDNLRTWRDGFLGLDVMVFCLPLWVAFPRADLSDDEWEKREEVLLGFQRVVENFRQVRAGAGDGDPVHTLLALTMSDDGRSALDRLREVWIEPYRRDPRRVLATLRTSSGAARYLVNARRISDAVREEFREAPEARVVRLPLQLDFGAGEPWIVPLSAIDGDRLAVGEDDLSASQARRRLAPPVPLHVELPLLVALCKRSNALM